MATNFGSKRLVVGARYGLRDWLAQRVTAVLMTLFTLVVSCSCCCRANSALRTAGPASSPPSG